MIARIPTSAPSPALRFDSFTSAASKPGKPGESASFETSLNESRRAGRSRDQTRSSDPVEKPLEPRPARAAAAKAKKEPVKTDEEIAVSQEETAPVGTNQPVETKASDTKPVESEAQIDAVSGETETEEIQAVDTDQQSEAAANKLALGATVIAIAADLSEQMAVTIAAGTEPVEQVAAQPLAAAPTTAPPPKTKPVAPTIDVANVPDVQADPSSAVPTSVEPTKKADYQPDSNGQDVAADTSDIEVKPASPKSDPSPAAPAFATASTSIDAATAPAPTLAPAPQQQVDGGQTPAAQFAQSLPGDDGSARDEANMGRITRGLHSAISQRGGSVTLRLTPPELGAVRIEMAVRDGVVNARFTAQTESVRNLLTDQMGHLRQALDRQGLSVDKIEVVVTPQASQSGGFDRQADDMSRDGRSAGQYASQQGDGGDRSTRQGRRSSDADSFERAMADVTQ